MLQVHLHSSEKMPELKDESVDLIVTSPPYKDIDGFSYETLSFVLRECSRVLKKDRLMFINFGHLANHKHRPFRVAELCEHFGFTWVDTIVWAKHLDGQGQFTPTQGDKRLNNLWEPIFMFSKGNKYSLDRMAIGVPYTDKSNVERWEGVEEDLRCRGNLWFIPYETIQKKTQKTHKDRFPPSLPLWCIKLAGLPKKSMVLDPFMGSGTTLYAAHDEDHDAVGYEINEDCIDPLLLFKAQNKLPFSF